MYIISKYRTNFVFLSSCLSFMGNKVKFGHIFSHMKPYHVFCLSPVGFLLNFYILCFLLNFIIGLSLGGHFSFYFVMGMYPMYREIVVILLLILELIYHGLALIHRLKVWGQVVNFKWYQSQVEQLVLCPNSPILLKSVMFHNPHALHVSCIRS